MPKKTTNVQRTRRELKRELAAGNPRAIELLERAKELDKRIAKQAKAKRAALRCRRVLEKVARSQGVVLDMSSD